MAQGIDEVKSRYAYVGSWCGPFGGASAELIAPDWIITAKHVAKNLIKDPDSSGERVSPFPFFREKNRLC
jgi:V8-like Glu-specific endopeptidase